MEAKFQGKVKTLEQEQNDMQLLIDEKQVMVRKLEQVY
jgi:hypothetical protein